VSDTGDELLRDQLDEEQYEVAARTDANVLVLAPPGSGKTRVLVNAAAHRVRHASELVGYGHARVMCLTFGNDAAREMQQRLERRPLSVRRQRMWVGNYHKLGMHLLHRYGHLMGWPRDAGLITSNESVVLEAIKDLEIKGVSEWEAAKAISRLKGRREVDEGAAETLHRIWSRYNALLTERRLRDFDDLILHTIELLDHVPQLRAILHDAYPFLFIDELQDTNLLQMDLIGRLVGDRTRVFAVADDDQMIYGWRDAHPENINEFVERFEAEEIALKGNYRCPPRIVDAANEVIVLNDRRRDVLMESRVKDRDGEVVIIISETLSEHEIVAQVIEEAVAEGIPLGQIAVLAPHRFKFEDVLDSLNNHSIRHVHPGGDRLATAPAVKVLRLALRCAAGGDITADDAAAVGIDGDADEIADAIRRSAHGCVDGNPRGLLSRLLAEFEWGTIRDPTVEPELLRVVARMFRKALDDERPSTTPELAADVVLHWDRLERAALREEDAVKIMTAFTAKGSEYQVVILPFMNEGIVPYKRRGEEIEWEEQRRVFYVALTRAERRVVLIRDGDSMPSAFLEPVEPHATSTESR
jgi:superfamily I DNA/RNA helicase